MAACAEVTCMLIMVKIDKHDASFFIRERKLIIVTTPIYVRKTMSDLTEY